MGWGRLHGCTTAGCRASLSPRVHHAPPALPPRPGREAALAQVVRRRGVLLTTYGMVQHNAEALAQHRRHDPDEGPLWDIMICGG